MKATKQLSLLALFLCILTSCDTIEELTEISFDTTETIDVDFDVPEGETTFTESTSVSINNEDVQDNIGNIESVKINTLSYKLIGVSGNEDATISATISFGDGSIMLSQVNLAAVEDQTFIINDEATVDAFSRALSENSSVMVTFMGNVENTPVKFTIRIIADATVKVSA